jgi:hypothetical protein
MDSRFRFGNEPGTGFERDLGTRSWLWTRQDRPFSFTGAFGIFQYSEARPDAATIAR